MGILGRRATSALISRRNLPISQRSVAAVVPISGSAFVGSKRLATFAINIKFLTTRSANLLSRTSDCSWPTDSDADDRSRLDTWSGLMRPRSYVIQIRLEIHNEEYSNVNGHLIIYFKEHFAPPPYSNTEWGFQDLRPLLPNNLIKFRWSDEGSSPRQMIYNDHCNEEQGWAVWNSTRRDLMAASPTDCVIVPLPIKMA